MNLRRQGEAAFDRGAFAEATGHWEAWLDACPDDHRTRHRLALAHFAAGSSSKAREEGEKALAGTGPASPSALLYGLVLVETGRAAKAATIVEAVTAVDKANPFAAGLTALAHLKAGRLREALDLFDEKGVFELTLFRAYVLAEIEACLATREPRKVWREGYLKTVL